MLSSEALGVALARRRLAPDVDLGPGGAVLIHLPGDPPRLPENLPERPEAIIELVLGPEAEGSSPVVSMAETAAVGELCALLEEARVYLSRRPGAPAGLLERIAAVLAQT